MRTLLALFILCAACVCAWAQAATFTEPQFIDRFNARLAKDGQDPVRACKARSEGQFICSFAADVFLTTLDEKADITGSIGTERAPTTMIVNMESDAIESIYLSGDRASPADLINFTAHLESLLHTLGPDESDQTIEDDTLSLGLLRGDEDPTIGMEREVSARFALIKCLNQPFGVSGGIGCAIKLRHAG